MTWDTGYGPQPYASATYTAAGQLATLSYGAGTETRSYNNLMQLINVSVPGYLNMTYNYVPGQNNGRIASSGDGIMGESVSYTYDALNRLTAASSGAWSEQYGFDGFGNLTSKTGTGGSPNPAPSMTASYDAHNHLTSATYDANGNQTSSPGFTRWYSMENRVSAQYSTAWPYPDSFYGYDPSGKRVMKETNPDPRNLNTGSNPTFEFYMYGITGQRLVTVDCNYSWQNPLPNCWVVGENVYFGRKLLVSNGVNVVTDRLGSVRANTQGEKFAYYPYGEERTSTVDGRDKFATYLRDGAGQDYADQRYYNSSTGRFWTPDPGGISTADPSNPISMNRYAYVNGDPINFRDRHGLFMQANPGGDDDGDDDDDDDDDVPSGSGGPGCGPAQAMLRILRPMAVPSCPSPGPVSSGGSPGTWLQDTLLRAAAIAEDALKQKDCAGMFGGSISPASELADLVAGTVAGSGFTYADLGPPSGGSVTAATTVGIAGSQVINGVNTSVFTGAAITINDNLFAPWIGGYPDTFDFGSVGSTVTQDLYRAITLIHELGHFYNTVTGMGGSSIIDDGLGTPAGTSQRNSAMVFQNCFAD